MKKTKKYITRNEAAEILAVNPQSISYCAERGLLTLVRSPTNSRVRLFREEVEALRPQSGELSKKELLIEEYKNVLVEDCQKLCEKWAEQKKLLIRSSLCVTYTKQLVEDIYCLIAGTQDDLPGRALLRILRGEESTDVANSLGISYSGLKTLCKEALRNVSLLPKYEEMYKQNDRLKSEFKDLTSAYKMLCEQYNVLASIHRDMVKKNSDGDSS